MEQVPKTWDWVKARAGCSLESVFALLKEVVKSDVGVMQNHKRGDVVTLEVNDLTQTKFAVTKTRNDAGVLRDRVVLFELSRGHISVRDGGGNQRELFTARPALAKNGECKLTVNDEQESLELWQVSRLALEDLFFGD